MTERQRVTSGSPYEATFGFARAVREGNRIIVAGTGPVEPDGSTTPGGAADVARTRMLLTDPADQEAVGAVHARFFSAAKPAATMAGVAWLCRPEWRVEIEAEAVVAAQD
jgi:enamine deaminase RidA (YjgF/YER057c/UK114 family)